MADILGSMVCQQWSVSFNVTFHSSFGVVFDSYMKKKKTGITLLKLKSLIDSDFIL